VLDNLLALATITLAAAIITEALAALFDQEKGWPSPAGWSEKEGIIVFIVVWFTIVAMALVKNWVEK
jgi:hypothetical protein